MEDDDQFATVEEALLHRHTDKVQWYPTPTPKCPVTEEPVKEKRLPPPNQIMRIQNPPPGWCGNVRKEHDPKSELCHCQQCYLEEYPYLVVVDPAQVSPQYPITTPQMQEMAGLYNPRLIKLVVHCAVCNEIIEVDVRLKHQEEAVHMMCLPEDQRDALLGMGIRAPYIIRVRREPHE
jgi:hypothetical protein